MEALAATLSYMNPDTCQGATSRSEDCRRYEAHLAAAAALAAAVPAGRADDVDALKQEARAYGWGYLSGEEGAEAERAWFVLAEMLGR